MSRYLGQEKAKGPFRSSGQAATCYYQSNHLKVETIPLSPCRRTQQANFRPISTIILLNAERQAGKL